MNEDIARNLLSTTATGIHSTRELVRLSGYSPNTVVRYLKGLEDRGLIERVRARKLSRGRPPIIHRLTPLGIETLRNQELSSFVRLRKTTGVLWGPRRSFSFWGIPLVGRADLFARRTIHEGAFDVVIEKRPGIYEAPIETEQGVFPRLEPFIAWAAGSTNPRYLGAASVLLRAVDLEIGELVRNAETLGTVNRVGFLAALRGAEHITKRLQRRDSYERMLAHSAPVDRLTEEAAARWHIRNPLSASITQEMIRLYGGPG